MWSVVFYPAGGVAKVLDRFEQRGEAEAHQQKLQRMMPLGFELNIVFEAIALEPAA